MHNQGIQGNEEGGGEDEEVNPLTKIDNFALEV